MSSSWNPMVEALRRRLEDDIVPAVQAQARPRKWKTFLWTALFAMKQRWLDGLFLLITLIPLIIGGFILATSHPWSVKAGTKDYAGVVVTAATATAFGGVLFSLVASPLQAASELAAGYSTELLRRRTLWLTGAWLVVLAIGLFVLGAMRPDQETAIASGLLTGSSLGLVWTSARSLLASSDPQIVAQRVARFIKRGMKDSREYSTRIVRSSLPRELRDKPPGLMLIRQEERRIVNGFLRYFKAGIEGALAHRQPASAIALWNSALDSFIEYAKERDGDIGDSQGITETLLAMVDEMVQQGLAIPLDDVPVHAITSLEQLVAFDVGNDSYSVVRSVALIKLKNWIQSGWADDHTRVPATAIHTISKLLRHSVRVGAHEDAIHALSALHEIGAQAIKEGRTHISKAAMLEIVSALHAFLAADTDRLRGYLVKRWAQDAAVLSRLRLMESNVFFVRATEAIFPGITLWGKGLQDVLAELGPFVTISSQVVEPLTKWLRGALRDFGSKQENPVHYFAIEGLALVYCLSLTQAYAVAANQTARPDEAQQLVEVLLRWVAWLPDDEAGEVLLQADLAELVWSILLATGYTASDRQLVVGAAKAILAKLAVRLAQEEPVFDSLSTEFIAGLMLAIDKSDQEIEEVIGRLRDQDEWMSDSRGMYIDGFGRAPSANRNQVAVSDNRLYDEVNRWAVSEFPRFVSVEQT